jgi:hypothetical protein
MVRNRQNKTKTTKYPEYNNDEKVTIEALRAHVVFRKAWQLDALMASGWNGSQVLSKYCGYGFCGPDRDGN